MTRTERARLVKLHKAYRAIAEDLRSFKLDADDAGRFLTILNNNISADTRMELNVYTWYPEYKVLLNDYLKARGIS